MARTPKELTELLLKERADEVSAIEERIDRILMSRRYDSDIIQAKDLGEGMLRDVIIDRYRAAGWDVKEHYESGDYTSDGYHYYRFNPKKGGAV